MPSLARAWIAAARARDRARPSPPPREELVLRHAPDATFADVACMRGVDGAMAFLAEEAGAARVTGVDVVPASDHFLAEHERRGSKVRFVRDDIADPDTLAEVGRHDVVFCWGLLSRVRDPPLTLERLRAITGRTLILAAETLPEAPGLRGACVFLPALDEASRAALGVRGDVRRLGAGAPPLPAQADGDRWWAITPSALDALLTTSGFAIAERHDAAAHAVRVARPAPTPE